MPRASAAISPCLRPEAAASTTAACVARWTCRDVADIPATGAIPMRSTPFRRRLPPSLLITALLLSPVLAAHERPAGSINDEIRADMADARRAEVGRAHV